MGFFDFFKMPDINQEIHAYKETKEIGRASCRERV